MNPQKYRAITYIRCDQCNKMYDTSENSSCPRCIPNKNPRRRGYGLTPTTFHCKDCGFKYSTGAYEDAVEASEKHKKFSNHSDFEFIWDSLNPTQNPEMSSLIARSDDGNTKIVYRHSEQLYLIYTDGVYVGHNENRIAAYFMAGIPLPSDGWL